MDEVKGTILIVDDEEAIRNVVSRRLEAEGYKCVIAARWQRGSVESVHAGLCSGASGHQDARHVRNGGALCY